MTVRFGSTVALDGVTFDLRRGDHRPARAQRGRQVDVAVALAAFRRPTSGQVLVDGEDPYEQRRLMGEITLSGRDGDVLGPTGRSARPWRRRSLRPRWDQELAERLLDRFRIDAGEKSARCHGASAQPWPSRSGSPPGRR